MSGVWFSNMSTQFQHILRLPKYWVTLDTGPWGKWMQIVAKARSSLWLVSHDLLPRNQKEALPTRQQITWILQNSHPSAPLLSPAFGKWEVIGVGSFGYKQQFLLRGKRDIDCQGRMWGVWFLLLVAQRCAKPPWVNKAPSVCPKLYWKKCLPFNSQA